MRFSDLVAGILALLVFSASAQRLEVSENDDGLLVSENGKKVLFYQTATKSLNGNYPRAHYIHPLFGIDGAILTEDFPEDHLHHRGIFWAWHQIHVGDKAVGDSWECKDFIWEVNPSTATANIDGSLSLKSETLWKSPLWIDKQGILKPFMIETTTITAFPQTKNYRVLDLETSLIAMEKEVRIGGSEDSKGYGGFSLRMKLPDDIGFQSRNGEVFPKTSPVIAAPWMQISGSLGEKGGQAGIVMMSYPPENQDEQQWILRKQGSMQNIPFPGRKPILISDKEPTRLKYRLIIYRGKLAAEQIESLYKNE